MERTSQDTPLTIKDCGVYGFSQANGCSSLWSREVAGNHWRKIRKAFMSSRTLYQNGEYFAKNPSWHVEESPWKATQILRMLARNQISPTTVCDVGCGVGEVLNRLQQNLKGTCTFWGYDVSPLAIERARSRANENLHFCLSDFRDVKESCFEVLLVLDVIEHLEDYFSFLELLKARARYKIFHIPLDLSVQTVFRKKGLLKRRDMYGHLHYFTKETALETLRDANYEILDYFYTARSNELAAAPAQRLLRLPRQILFALHKDFTVRVLGGYSLLVLAR